MTGFLLACFGWTIFMAVVWFLFFEPKRSTQRRRRTPVTPPPVRALPPPAANNDEHGPHGPPRYNFVHAGMSHNRYYMPYFPPGKMPARDVGPGRLDSRN